MKPLLLLKCALHAHDRGQERLKLAPESVDKIQQLTDNMWYSYGRKKLTGDTYYSSLRDPHKNLLGYAAFQRVGNPARSRLILTTILSKEMKPKGDDIGNFFNSAIRGIYPISPNEPEKYKGMDPIPGSKKN